MAAWRYQTGIMILMDRGVESSYLNQKNEEVFHRGARGLKSMCGKEVCQRTMKDINARYNMDFPFNLREIQP